MDAEQTVTGPVERRRMLEQGWGDRELRSLQRRGELVAVRRGVYVAGADERLGTERGRHLLDVRAALRRVSEHAVVSHESAGVVHGLVMWDVDLRRPHFTRPRRTGGRRDPRLRIATAPLRPDEVVLVDGMPVTTVARTVADLLRTVGLERGVVIADWVLHRGAASPGELAEAVARSRGWPGVPSARRALAFADARSESVGESRSRVAIARIGLPRPEPQAEVRRSTGRLLARCDFWWPGRATVGEFDGRVKYGRELDPDADPGDVVFREKQREDALRTGGLEVARWVWSDLRDFRAAASRIQQAFARAASRRR